RRSDGGLARVPTIHGERAGLSRRDKPGGSPINPKTLSLPTLSARQASGIIDPPPAPPSHVLGPATIRVCTSDQGHHDSARPPPPPPSARRISGQLVRARPRAAVWLAPHSRPPTHQLTHPPAHQLTHSLTHAPRA